MFIEQYKTFLESKIKVAAPKGFKIDRAQLHPSNKFHQNDIIEWGIERGAGLIAADTGLGKTAIALEISRIIISTEHLLYNNNKKALIVTELGAAETFINQDPEVGEGARLGLHLSYVTNQGESDTCHSDVVVTNYERVRMGCFDFSRFSVVCLDEGNYIKNMASETTDTLTRELAKVKFKYVFTATPSPNEVLELINYAHVLGIADRGGILTRFFQRDSTKAGVLTVHSQHEDDFWLWVYSWAVFIQRPSDLGYDDEGYDLPPLNVYWHEVKLNKSVEVKADRDGQTKMFSDGTGGIPEQIKLKRFSINERLQAALDIIKEDDPDLHWIIWHHLEDERKAINKAFKDHPSYADVYGTLNWKEKEKRIVDFSKGDLQMLATKGEINGVGCNLQKHCHNNIVLGVTDSFDELYQLLKRTHRYGQKFPVNAHIFYLPEEYKTVQNLKRKWKEHDEARAKTRELYLKYGLNYMGAIAGRSRTFITERKEWKGQNFTIVNNDSVLEYHENVPENSVDLINTSIPFGNHYEYSDRYNDFGHNEDNEHFFKQMDFLIPQLYKALKPGRIAAVHTKNRIHYGSVTGLGFSIFHRFTHAACDAFERHGFQTMGFHYIPTDVVAENNQTYRLGFGELQKDSTKMGSGIPEEIWIFRKPPTFSVDAYADEPVEKNCQCPFCGRRNILEKFTIEKSFLYQCFHPKCRQFIQPSELIISNDQNYSLAKWQIDADSFWKSSGDRILTPDELLGMNMKQVRAWCNEFNSSTVYDFEEHVKLLKTLDDKDRLSKTFTTLPLRSNTPFVWNDVNRMHGLNLEQSRRNQQNHICPMPFDEVDRIIDLYSNEGEQVDDPFGGLGTTGVRAIKKKRKTRIVELNSFYAQNAYYYLRQAEESINIPTLFDLIEMEQSA